MRRGVALATTAVLVFGASSAAAVTYRLTHNIKRVNIDALLPRSAAAATPKDPSDPNTGQPVNILLLGSDARNGENAAIGGEAVGERSDTAIVLHISADRSRVEAVSIPRDSIVQIPACTMTNHKTSKPRTDMFNSAFATGWDMGGDIASAAACTMNTVQVNTGITLDHFVVVDFAGFQKMVDAVGGIDICVTSPINDTVYTGYKQTAGLHHMAGPEALMFARVRHGIGDGSDLQRIKRQQELLGSLAHQVLSKNVLTNAPELLTFLSAVTSSLTTDSRLSPTTIAGLAYTLKNISAANIVLMTIPNGPAPDHPAKVVWTSAATPIWADIAADTPLVPATAPTTSAPTTPTAPGSAVTTTPTASPATATTPPGILSVQDVQNQATTTCAA
jgi:LCP family protein required for cell wall assembly